MKRSLFCMLMAFAMTFLFASFEFEASAQSNNNGAEDFLSELRNELMAENDILNVKSVTLKDNVIVVDAAAKSADIPAELIYEILVAAKKYAADNQTEMPADMKEGAEELESMGVSFRFVISEFDGGKRYDVDYTVDEFAGFYMFQNIDANPQQMMDMLSYLPFEKLIGVMNTIVKDSGMQFACEDGLLYMVMTMKDDELSVLRQMYDYDKEAFTGVIKKSMFASLGDEKDSQFFLNLVHENGYRFAFRATSPGCEPINIVLE